MRRGPAVIEAIVRVPGTHRGDEQPRGRLDVDEANARDPEALGEIAGDVDLEATGDDDLAVAHDACLQDRIAEPERDDELRRTGLGSDGGRGGGSSARLSAGRPRRRAAPQRRWRTRRCRRRRRSRRRGRAPLKETSQVRLVEDVDRGALLREAEEHLRRRSGSRARNHEMPRTSGRTGYSWKAMPPVK